MDLILNELSIHAQFRSLTEFEDAIERLFRMRHLLERHQYNLYCHRSVPASKVSPDSTVWQVTQSMNRDRRRALMTWLTRLGPFWEDTRRHREDDWIEYNGEVVTDTALGEAAYSLMHGIDRGLVSLDPSDWLTPILPVSWKDNGHLGSARVPNYWSTNALQERLENTPNPADTWKKLAAIVRSRFGNLTFADDSFDPLDGYPFSKGQAEGIVRLLKVLDEFKTCFDSVGSRTLRGQEIYQEFFTGRNAWFSDSSTTEKHQFEKELTFPHPEKPGRPMMCSWHGKIRTGQLRIHFSELPRANKPLYIVYVGQKITRR